MRHIGTPHGYPTLPSPSTAPSHTTVARRVPGIYLIMSSTRAKLGGVFAALTYLRLIIEYYKVKLPYAFPVTLFCDSQAALCRLTQIDTDIALTQFSTTWRCRANYDFEAALKAATSTLPFPVHWQWIQRPRGTMEKSR
jgi:hypothetical protein